MAPSPDHSQLAGLFLSAKTKGPRRTADAHRLLVTQVLAYPRVETLFASDVHRNYHDSMDRELEVNQLMRESQALIRRSEELKKQTHSILQASKRFKTGIGKITPPISLKLALRNRS
jgi:hypothetical protein